MQAQILAPGAVLIAWSLIMLIWTASTRLPAMSKMMKGKGPPKPGGRGQDLEGVLPDKVNWKAHNYAHLMEQPTIFYPVLLILAVMGAVTPTAILLAWAYVGLRIAHSVWQATVNTIFPVRFGLFIASTICLIALSIMALMATIGADVAAVPA